MDPIIDLQTTVSDKAPARASFGVPLILGRHTRFPNRIRGYAEASDMLADGFVAADPEYQMALVLKAQVPTVNRFKVGKLLTTAAWTHTVLVTPTNTTAGLVYEGTINGEDVSVTVAPADTVALICDKLVLAATGIPGVTATDSTTHVTLTGSAGTIVALANMSEYYTLEDTTTVTGSNVQADLTAINDEDSDWYGIASTLNSAQMVAAVSAWAQANKKVYVPQLSDTEVINPSVTDDIASSQLALSYDRVGSIYHPDIGGSQWANAAFLAVNMAPDPGSYTPAFKELRSVRTSNLKQAGRTALQAKNVTRYQREFGLNITYEGKTPSGRFFDVVRFLDWLEYTIKANLTAYLANNPKAPNTNKGRAGIKGNIEGSLLEGIRAGGLDGEDVPPVVTVPSLAESTVADRAARILRNITWTGRLTGALHGLVIRGNISV
jgi:hypothetical protein